ncbi:MAG TPA: STAS domain-containing protein [Roseiflexaceae bacterium]|nr:STAS domain-containing protein [Roseiflexaceae bacterium]
MLHRLLKIQTRDADPLTLRRGQSLAILLIVLIVLTVLFSLADLLATGNLQGTLINGAAILLFLVIYAINRSGRLALAINIMLASLSVLPISASFVIGSPIPQIFFPCLIVVIAAAFGRPHSTLIWAAIVSLIPWLANLALFGSPLPPAGPVMLPNGAAAPPLLLFDVVAVVLYWMVAGVSWLATRQLYLTIDESRAATQAAIEAQQLLTAQQADLAARNEELTQARQDLEALVSELTVPVVPVADGVGLLPLVGSLDAGRAARIEEDALKIVAEQRLQALIVDLSGASGLRATSVERLVRLCAALQLLGVTPVLAGLGAQSALLLSSIDIALPRTVATVQDALALFQSTAGRRVA